MFFVVTTNRESISNSWWGLRMCESDYFIRKVIKVNIYQGLTDDLDRLLEYILIFVFNRIKYDLVGAVTNRYFIQILGDVTDFEFRHRK